MQIQIEYNSPFDNINIFFDLNKNLFICNGKKVSKSMYEFKEILLNIIFAWDYEMINNELKDAESYKIDLTTEDGDFHFIGQGFYPENFNDFKKLIMEVANG